MSALYDSLPCGWRFVLLQPWLGSVHGPDCADLGEGIPLALVELHWLAQVNGAGSRMNGGVRYVTGKGIAFNGQVAGR